MNRKFLFAIEYLKGKMVDYHFRKDGELFFRQKQKVFNHKKVFNIHEASMFLQAKISSGRPFMTGRFGATELATIKTFDFENRLRYESQLKRVGTTAGLFPETEVTGKKFAEIMKKSIEQVDLMGIWPLPFEEYYLKTYGNSDLQCTWLRNLEPWLYPEDPWSSALAGKTVLIVGIFSESVKQQYKKRELLFPDTNILPDFKLKTYQSVWTSHGCDPRFKDWFEALDLMKNEILSIKFDIAILGCGAYGFPLAAEIKKAGRQAIHLGGATQLLFGITGTRWQTDDAIQALINDAWVRPMKSEIPAQAGEIENSAYW